MRPLLSICLLALGFFGCAGGTETGNPAVSTGIALGAYSSDPATVAVSQGAGGAVVQQAWVSFGVFDFRRAGECGGMSEIDNESGPIFTVVDLADPDTRMGLDLEAGTYCGLVVPLERITAELPEGAPAELADHSIVVRGERADGVAFTLAYPEQDELELTGVSGDFDLEADGKGLLLLFDVSVWMNGVDLQAAALSTDGTIRIDVQNNPELREAFETNVECALQLYRDLDEDGALDPGEPLLAACGDEE
jgi:hypothetical protein